MLSWFSACTVAVSMFCFGTADRSFVAEQQDGAPVFQSLNLDPVLLQAMEPDSKDSPARKLLRERCYIQAVALDKFQTLMEIGKWIGIPESFAFPVALSEDLAALLDKPADQLKCYEFRLEFLKLVEKHMPHQVAIGTQQSYAVNLAVAARMDAEIDLLAFQAKIAKAKK